MTREEPFNSSQAGRLNGQAPSRDLCAPDLSTITGKLGSVKPVMLICSVCCSSASVNLTDVADGIRNGHRRRSQRSAGSTQVVFPFWTNRSGRPSLKDAKVDVLMNQLLKGSEEPPSQNALPALPFVSSQGERILVPISWWCMLHYPKAYNQSDGRK